uniref:Uncharacterized protein n=1 Tax=Meloidogyne enterolobii TaxID=390850 RepID=A0A6V7TTH0_MELEN|nr:unnamed protein product [Meloidogyne enterolobii]
MLIFIHLILYIFICSLQSITKNVYGIEDPSNNNPKQLKSIYDKDEHPLTIERYKRYPGDGGLEMVVETVVAVVEVVVVLAVVEVAPVASLYALEDHHIPGEYLLLDEKIGRNRRDDTER